MIGITSSKFTIFTIKLSAVLCWAFSSPAFSEETPESFSFFAIGDTAYCSIHEYESYQPLVEKINASRPAFTIHIGDTGNVDACLAGHDEAVKAFFNTFNQPLIYTPGDNEWVDCNSAAGSFVGGTDRNLARIRKVFFNDLDSEKDRYPRGIVQQSTTSEYQVPENLAWQYGNVQFGTVHVPGTWNRYEVYKFEWPRTKANWEMRDLANQHWIEYIFSEAKKNNLPAVVLSLHADLENTAQSRPSVTIANRPIDKGFANIVSTLIEQVKSYGKQVLLINGDVHIHDFSPNYFGLDNLTRLRTGGHPEMLATKVTIDTSKNGKEIFSATKLQEEISAKFLGKEFNKLWCK